MFCSNCGAEVSGKFCPYCGCKLPDVTGVSGGDLPVPTVDGEILTVDGDSIVNAEDAVWSEPGRNSLRSLSRMTPPSSSGVVAAQAIGAPTANGTRPVVQMVQTAEPVEQQVYPGAQQSAQQAGPGAQPGAQAGGPVVYQAGQTININTITYNNSPTGNQVTYQTTQYPNPAYTGNVPANKSPKEKSVALLLCFFLGFFGVHHFYANRPIMGLIYLFTGGIWGIGWLIDLILIATGNYKDSDGNPIL